MLDVLVSLAVSALLLALVFFLLWRGAVNDALYWKWDADYWFDAWTKVSTRRRRRDPADWWKGGGGG